MSAKRARPERFIAYIDILGFSAATPRLLADATALKSLEDAVHRCILWAGGGRAISPSPVAEWWWKHFADSFFLSQPATTLGLLNLFDVVAAIQRELVTAGFLSRGGIARGTITSARHVVVSDAACRAVEIEHLIKLPAVAIDLPVVDAIVSEPDSFLRRELGEMLAMDTRHGFAFVSPYIFAEDDEWLGGHRFYVQMQALLAAVLRRGISAGVRCKYQWAAEFHNWNIETARWQHLAHRCEALSEDQCWNYRALTVRNVKVPRVFCALSSEFDRLGTGSAWSRIPVYSLEKDGDQVFDTDLNPVEFWPRRGGANRADDRQFGQLPTAE
ncbi:MAG TPA: hypothetical protein VFF65_04325 [Phycisphaerales bacterium]|nr:hypothetical protein [Phycisphaerales bacterium]